VTDSPRPEPGSETSKEAARKRKKNDAGLRPEGKQMKVSSNKKVAAPKVAVTLKGTSVASLKAAFAHEKAVPKAGAPPMASAWKVVAVRAIPHAAQVALKARVLWISTGVKRPASTEPSSVQARKKAKVGKAPSSTPASARKATTPVQLADG
jgi:hypothetical protein